MSINTRSIELQQLSIGTSYVEQHLHKALYDEFAVSWALVYLFGLSARFDRINLVTCNHPVSLS